MSGAGPGSASGTMAGVEIVVPDRLDGEGVVLRPLRVADAGAYASAFRQDTQMGRLLGVDRDPTEAEVTARVEGAAERARAGRAVQLAVSTAEGESLLGEVSLHSFAWKHRRCEIGFWIAPAARGRGLASDAIGRTLQWAFEDLAIERMEMATTPGNVPTRALARRLGFVQEGVQRKRNLERGQRVDMVIFGLLAREWAEQRAATP